MKILFERTWCDYLTKCKRFPEIEVGSYECNICKHCKSIKENKTKDWKIGEYGRYFEIINGVVECDCNE